MLKSKQSRYLLTPNNIKEMTLSVNIPNISPVYLEDVMAKVSAYANSYVLSLQESVAHAKTTKTTKATVPHHTSERLKSLKLHTKKVVPSDIKMEDIYEC